MTSDCILYSLIPISAMAAAYSKHYGLRKLHLITKPLTMVLIIILAFVFYRDSYVQGKLWVIIALSLSLTGDIFLMFKEKFFKAGLFAFLFAHIFYLVFFIDGLLISKLINYYSLMVYIIAGVIAYLITENAGKYKISVSAYIFALASMVAFSIPWYLSTGDFRAVLAAILFLISDFVLGYNKFVKEVKFAELVILPTYFAAQFLFALLLRV